jgi:predicted dehydrogenase
MSRRSSILIAGVGSIGERHLRCFIASGRADVSFCEVNAPLRRKIAEQYGVEHSFDSFEGALAAKPDAVVICTPAHLHVPMALAAARSEAHLLIEKPLSTSLEGVAALEQEIIQRQRIAAVAYVYRAHPALAAMREAIHSGRFGKAVQMVATFGQHFPLYRPAYRQTYYCNRATGGGAVQDALTHVINAGEWLVGSVERLVADAAHQVLDGVKVEDTVHVLTRHGEVMGDFSLNQHQAPNEGTLTVICERGTARFEYHNARWRWMTEPGGDWHDESVGPLERDTLFLRQAGAFLDAIAGIKPPLCTLAEATQTLRVNLAILSSVEKQNWQTISAKEAAHA